MYYLVCYDIEEDRHRSRIAHILEGFGQRVQKSVFECHLDGKAFQRLVQLLERTFQPQGNDSIRIYPICADCRRGAVGMGQLPEVISQQVAFIHV